MIVGLDVPLQRWLVTTPGQTDQEGVFPLLPGQVLLTGKSPVWSTEILKATDGSERRRSAWSYPKWRIKTKYEVLRDRPSQPELRKLWEFFCLVAGQRQSFRFFDPYDFLVSDQVIGTGDGSETSFQLVRTLWSQFQEPIRDVSTVTLLVDGVQTTDYTIDEGGVVSLASAPSAGAVVSWSGSFYFRCRFNSDELSAAQMTRDLWSQDGIELITVRR